MESIISKLASINGYTRRGPVEVISKLTTRQFTNSEGDILFVASSEKASKPDTTQFIASIDELGASVKAGVYICETPKCLGRDVLEAGKRAYPNVTFMTMTKAHLKTATSENIFMPEVVAIIRKGDEMIYNGEIISQDVQDNSPVIRRSDPVAKLHLLRRGDVIVTKQRYGTSDVIGKRRLHLRVCK